MRQNVFLMSSQSKKKQVIAELFAECAQRGEWEFDNQRVKELCLRVGFGNPFDVIEAKSQFLSDFAVHQIFHPLHYYSEKLRRLGRNAHLNACYVLHKEHTLQLYLCEFG